MENINSILLIVQVILSICLIVLVLIQHGKGADAGAAFGGGGGGASSTVFGSRGSGSFLTRMTTLFALAFFGTSILLFYLASQRNTTIGSVVDGVDIPAVEAPAAPESDAPALQPDLPAVEGAETPAAESESDVPTAPTATE